MALGDIIRQYDIKFKKSLGQNLLLDDNINRIMTDAAALSEEDDVVEVGAGLGALTSRLCLQAGRVLSVEIDRSFMPCLEEQFDSTSNVVLFRGDVLNHSVEKLVEEHLPNPRSMKMVSNLPYYITTPILFHFWESSMFFERMVVMVQEEVGLRMVSKVGAPDYGKLALACRYHAEVDIVHKVPASCFRPKPKVNSCIVRLRNRKEPLFPGVDGDFLMDIIGTAFSQRRKTLRNSLSKAGRLDFTTEKVLDAMATAEVDPSRRPQTLELEEFANIAKALKSS
ncbi:MAG: ribosomal RNA small subunit methyltransferase A [Candidatus Hydrogenedentota bacterium]|nr:MAG: ribosomal RNA small subunit methyltransferase A [Candidatus Hydrogenedentota bacterium]